MENLKSKRQLVILAAVLAFALTFICVFVNATSAQARVTKVAKTTVSIYDTGSTNIRLTVKTPIKVNNKKLFATYNTGALKLCKRYVHKYTTYWQVKYSTSKKFTKATTKTKTFKVKVSNKVTTKKSNKSSKTVNLKPLKKDTKYFVKARAFVKTNGKKKFGSWSKLKNCSTDVVENANSNFNNNSSSSGWQGSQEPSEEEKFAYSIAKAKEDYPDIDNENLTEIQRLRGLVTAINTKYLYLYAEIAKDHDKWLTCYGAASRIYNAAKYYLKLEKVEIIYVQEGAKRIITPNGSAAVEEGSYWTEEEYDGSYYTHVMVRLTTHDGEVYWLEAQGHYPFMCNPNLCDHTENYDYDGS